MSNVHLKSSLQFNSTGRTGLTYYQQHIRNLIEHLLFTQPGERVNRPTFGSGLLQMVFEPNSPEIAATTQFLIQGALNQWLGNLIEVNKIEVTSIDARLEVFVAYTILKDKEQQTVEFSQAL
jgi:uncharacterized protein